MADKAEIRNIPQNDLLGALADALMKAKQNTGVIGDFLLGKAPETLENMSYGFNPTRGSGMAFGFKPEALDVANLIPTSAIGGLAARGYGKLLTSELARHIAEGTQFGRMIDPRASIVPTEVAKSFAMKTSLPDDEEFLSAVRGTNGAEITPEGLKIKLIRYQRPEQELAESVRSGVFYLPEGNPNVKFYKNAGTASNRNTYGGINKIQGETILRNPLFVKGATGGKAPEEAYKKLMGKQAFKEMQDDLMKTIRARDKGSEAYMFLEKYAPEIADTAWNIAENSTQGNQFRYALQEAVFGNAARNAGYDSILGYSKGRGDKGNFFSEVFDLREQLYPSSTGEYGLMPEFENIIK